MTGRIRYLGGAAVIALIAAGTGPAAGAQDLPPLRENARVWNSLFAAAVADEIRTVCPTMSARMFRAMRAAMALESYARGLGYSEAQIEAFLDDDQERDRMRAARDTYLAEHGVAAEDVQSYCRLGRKEIARKTLTGSLLRESN